MKPFDLVSSPVTGHHLIEASAGTGKTFTLAHLYLRLVLERGFAADRILVVTFTEAATAELRDRIHALLTTALERCRSGVHGDGPLGAILDKADSSAAQTLERALYAFDDAAICTIHGFCHRTLLENAFETGSLFNAELIDDQQEYVAEAAHDFWRVQAATYSPMFAAYLVDTKSTVTQLLESLARPAVRPGLRIVPQSDAWPDTSDAEAAFVARHDDMRTAWEAHADDVRRYLQESGNPKGSIYRKDSVARLLTAFPRYVQSVPDSPAVDAHIDKFELLTSSKLLASLKKDAAPPAPQNFYEACESFAAAAQALTDLYAVRLATLRWQFVCALRDTLAARKESRHVQSFDDLLVGLANALRGSRGSRLAGLVRRRYQAALIDEFQDTDQIQDSIFSRIFSGPDTTMFLIGDPKQAIYAFRGADIFTYMAAKKRVPHDHAHTLLTNHRSGPGLVDAVNRLFLRLPSPFLFDAIPFHEAVASEANANRTLLVDNRQPPPMTVWFLPGDESGARPKPVAVPHAADMLANACAAEASLLLARAAEGAATVDGAPLRPRDIAVLVRTNAQGRLVRDACAQAGVAAVMHGMGSVYGTHEACEVERLIAAVAEPANESLVRAALATRLLGHTAPDIVDLRNDESRMAAMVERFAAYRSIWLREGFAAMHRHVMDDFCIAVRVLALDGGERILTNVNHLAELLQAQAQQEHASIEDLLSWFCRQRLEPSGPSEEHELRLESDEDAVSILTVHRSKGLQYPVVFCPFVFGSAQPRSGPVAYHDAEKDDQLTLDIGSGHQDQSRAFSSREHLAEDIRMLYVALTRACCACYTAWGMVRGSHTSAAAALYHGEHVDLGDAHALRRLGEHVKVLGNGDLRAPLDSLCTQSPQTFAVTKPPHAGSVGHSRRQSQRELQCRTAGRRIDEHWRVASFTSLAHSRRDLAEEPDRDSTSLAPVAPPLPDPADGDTMFSFPRGAEAGTALHAVFEEMDFRSLDPAGVRATVSRVLTRHHFDERWVPVAVDMVSRVCTTTLTDDFTLHTVSTDARLTELEFYFPLNPVTTRDIADVFTRAGTTTPLGDTLPRQVGTLSFRPVEGYMHGFIDSVCEHDGRYYLIDWKSNYLGPTLEDYHPQALARVMREEHYYLQYHLYTVALNRYLSTRIPGYRLDTHFGGVLYVFLRGIGDGSTADTGVFRDTPDSALVQALDQALVCTTAVEGAS